MLNNNLIWLLSKYIHIKDWLSFLKLNITFYDFGFLLSSIDPSIYNDYAIRHAIQIGHDKIVESLLQDPQVVSCVLAFTYAIHIKIIELLLQDPRVEPSDISKKTLKYAAAINGYEKVVELLLQDPRE